MIPFVLHVGASTGMHPDTDPQATYFRSSLFEYTTGFRPVIYLRPTTIRTGTVSNSPNSFFLLFSLTPKKTRHQPGTAKRGSRRARKVDRRLGSGCVGSAVVGSEFWLVKVPDGTVAARISLQRGRGVKARAGAGCAGLLLLGPPRRNLQRNN